MFLTEVSRKRYTSKKKAKCKNTLNFKVLLELFMIVGVPKGSYLDPLLLI